MALVNCPDCKKQVSENAPTCLNCGAPIAQSVESAAPARTKRHGGLYEGIGTLMILGGMVYAMATPPDNHIGGSAAFIGFILFIYGRFN